ncbi:MAG: glycoside hydrolase family 13 protein [Bacteroidetes bacterium]|nr:glycoside hydrolase family 13 protein [Bacteroidota bacterium]
MKYFYKSLITLVLIMMGANLFAAKINLDRIDPPFWWTGMKNSQLQLMVHGTNISEAKPVIEYYGVRVKEIILVENPNYMFINLEIGEETKPGVFDIHFKKGKKTIATYKYQLKERVSDPSLYKGFDNSDVIYLLMPDRFSNGNPNNDDMPLMLETADRTNPNGRHGGDIEGMSNQLDYLSDLGITAIWANPLLENNMPAYSYHGYAVTDLYKVDPRFGTNEDYLTFIKKAHSKGIKVIMDMIFNHLGTGYYWKDDLPMKDWYNEWPEFTRSNYRGGTVSDPYASEFDYNKEVKGWFDKTMADLNQNNEFMANYLIQNSIWWIEYSGLDGIRQDTYPYPYKDFMAEWMRRLLEEYPDYNVVGEAWLSQPPAVAYWLDNNTNKDGYKSNLTNVFDFPLMYAISKAFNENEGWSTGTAQLYEVLSQDYVYSMPDNIVTFVDNHDGDRFYTKIQEDINKFKLAMAFMMTTRGIPSIYYGTEILMTGEEHKGHGDIRKDFPGGWNGDATNAFSKEGRTDDQNEAFDFIRRLLNWRKSNTTVQYGELTHYIPENGVYVYFKKHEGNTVMVMLNNTNEDKIVDLTRYSKSIGCNTKGRSVLTRRGWDDLSKIEISAKSPLIIELSK